MTVTSYRIYCQECDSDKVIRKDRMDSSPWKIGSLIHHEGICPDCNDLIDSDEAEVPFEKLDNIGEQGAENLRDNGIVTRGDVENASDEDILDVPWVGEAGLRSIRKEV